MTAVVTGVGLALSGVRTVGDLLAGGPGDAAAVTPADRLGRKGLRYQDRATQLALCAAWEALLDAGLVAAGSPVPAVGTRPALTAPAGSVAVVASSNLGNLDSVCEVATGIAADGGTRLVRPILAPRLSSNVVASETAIRFGLRGPNLMLCNGASSGLDAVHWAAALVAAGRARHVLVVGVEPDTDVVRRLHGREDVLDGAVALVVEPAEVAAERGAAVLGVLGRCVRVAGPAACVDALVPAGPDAGGPTLELWYVPEGSVPPALLPGVPRRDLAARWGAASGALGVLQCAAAVGHFGAAGRGPVLATAGADGDDATTGLLLGAPVTR